MTAQNAPGGSCRLHSAASHDNLYFAQDMLYGCGMCGEKLSVMLVQDCQVCMATHHISERC